MMGSLMENLPASLAGGVALFCLTTYPLFRSRKGILAMQLGAGAGFALHYALLGVLAASAVNVLGCVQTGAALFSGRSAASNRIGWALIPLMLLAGLYFWAGPVSAFSVVAMTLIAIGRMQQGELALRALMLSGASFWTLHDFLVGAWIAVAADIGCLTTGVAGLVALLGRTRRKERPAKVDESAPTTGDAVPTFRAAA